MWQCLATLICYWVTPERMLGPAIKRLVTPPPLSIIEIWQHSQSPPFLLRIWLSKIRASERNQEKLMTKRIVVFQVTGCYDTASLWPGWISAQRDLLSGDSGWVLHQSCTSQAWLVGRPPLPSTTYFSSEKQLPPITGPNSIRQGSCWRSGFPSASGMQAVAEFGNLGEDLGMSTFRLLSLCILVAHSVSVLSSKWV